MSIAVLRCIVLGVLSGAVLAQESPVPVFVAEVQKDRFVDRLEALGTLKANEAVILSVVATDTISAIHFQDGQRVKAGDVLVEMTHHEERALLQQARAGMAEALQQFERVKALQKSGSAALSLLDQRRREYEMAKAHQQSIEARLRDRLIVAPFNGVVGMRELSVGALVEPGDVITTLDDDSVMKLDFAVSSNELEVLQPGLQVVARAQALGGRVFEGKVAHVDFRIDPATRSVQVRALLPNLQRLLRSGLLMQVELLKNPREVVVIPEEAVVSEGRRHFVFRVNRDQNPMTVAKHEVKLGARRPGEVEVLDGLQPGISIVTHGTILVRDGSAVSIRAADKKGMSLKQKLQQSATTATRNAH